MVGFCGAIDLCGDDVSFSYIRKMCGLHTAGCAFINGSFGILCDGDIDDSQLQPVTVSHNGYLYTAAVVCETPDGEFGRVAQAVLEGYIEEGEGYIHRLDFPYAVALYDGRCGELLLTKGHLGDIPLFFSLKDGKVYFATSLTAMFRLFDGSVRVDRRMLISHIMGKMAAMPSALFPDISYVSAGQGLLCSRLGVSRLVGTQRAYVYEPQKLTVGELPPKVKKGHMRSYLKDALYAFGYPQFDCYMPAFMSYLKNRSGTRGIRIQDNTLLISRTYSIERAQRLGRAAGIRVVCMNGVGRIGRRTLWEMEKEIDSILKPYIDGNKSILRSLGVCMNDAKNEKDTATRIRKKGMLAQCAMWFESYDLILV